MQFNKTKNAYIFTSEDMKKMQRVKNACVFPRDLYVLCSLAPTSYHIIKRTTLHRSWKIWLLFSRVENNILLFSPLEDTIHTFAPPCNIFYILYMIFQCGEDKWILY